MADDGWTNVDDYVPAPDTSDWSPLSDSYKAVKSGIESTLAEGASEVRYANEGPGSRVDPVSRAVFGFSKALQDYLNQSASDTTQAMTPGGRARLTETLSDPDFYNHPAAAVALQTLGMAPAAAAVIGATILAPEVTGATTAASVAAGAGLGHASYLNSLQDSVDNMDDGDLQKTIPYYRELRDTGMQEFAARQQLDQKMAGSGQFLAALGGAVAGAIGPAAGIARGWAGEAASGVSSRLGGGVAGAVEGGIGIGVQNAATNYAGQQAQQSVGQKTNIDWGNVADAAAQGVLLGAVPGGAAGALFRGGSTTPGAKPDSNNLPPLPEQASAPPKGYGTGATPPPREDIPLGNTDSAPTRSEQRYPKGNNSGGETADTAPTIETTAPATPDTDQSIALSEGVAAQSTLPPPIPTQPAPPPVPKGAMPPELPNKPTGTQPQPVQPPPVPVATGAVPAGADTAKPPQVPQAPETPPVPPQATVPVPTQVRVQPSPADLYQQAVQLVRSSQKASTKLVQAQLRLKYGDAVKIMAQLEKDGVITAADKNGRRSVIAPKDSPAQVMTSSGPVTVDNSYDVASYANSSKDPNGPVVVDKSVPQYSPTLKTKAGQPAPLWQYVAEHEVQEKQAMAQAIAQFKEINGRDPNAAELKAIYEDKHINVATPAERKMVEADGIDFGDYSRTVNGYVKALQEKKAENPPPFELHIDPDLANSHYAEHTPAADAVLTGKPAEAKAAGRVLKPVDKESLENVAAQNKAIRDNLKQAAEESEGEAPRGGKHLSKAEKARADADELAAQQIVERHTPAGSESDDAVIARAKSMVDEANQHGVPIKKVLRGEQSAPAAILREASDLTRATSTKAWKVNQKYRTEWLSRFRAREAAARSGDVHDVLSERRAEGDAAKRASQGDVEQAPEIIEGAPTGGGTKQAPVVGSETRVGDADLRGVSDGTEVTPEGNTRAKAVTRELSEEAKAEIAAKYGMKFTPKVADVKERVAAAAAKADRNPTESQKVAGNYEKGHAYINGLDVTIENPKGSIRTGVDKNGKPWAVKVPDHYGYIRRTEGMDHENVDTYVGPNLESPHVFVVDQVDPDTKAPDEHKVMLGYKDAEAAQDAYRKAFSDGRADDRVGAFHAMSVPEFKEWLKGKGEAGPKQPVEAALRSERSHEIQSVVSTKRGTATPLKSWRLRDILPKADLSSYGPLASFIRRKILDGAGDVPVHLLTKEAIDKLSGDPADGFFYQSGDPNGPEYIAIREGLSQERAIHSILHEGVHALTIRRILDDPQLLHEITTLMDAVRGHWASHPDVLRQYGFRNEQEFIAEAMSNRDFQQLLRNTPISDEMAKSLGLPAWRKYSMWAAFVNSVRKILKLPSNTYTALEASIALTERATVDTLPVDARMAAVNKGLNESPRRPSAPIEASLAAADAIHDAVSGVKDAAGRFAEHPVDTMVNAVKEAAARPNSKGMLRRIGDALTTSDQYAQQRDVKRLVPQSRSIFDMIEKQGATANRLKKPGAALVADMLRTLKGNPERFRRFSKLVNEQTMYGVNAAHGLGEGDNAHLALSKANLAKVANGTFKPSDAPMEQWGARGAHPELAKAYQKLVGEDPRYADLQKRLFAFSKEAQGAIAHGHISEFLRAGGIDDPGVRAQRAAALLSTRITQEGKEQLVNEFGENIANSIIQAKKLSGSEGPYVPLMRHGDYVVGGRYKIDDPANAINKPNEDSWEFKTRDEAHKFAESTDLPYDVSSVYYDPQTGERTTKMGETQTSSPEQRFNVDVQRQHTEFHEDKQSAWAAQAELAKSGLFETEPYVQNKEQFISQENEIGAGAMGKMLSSLEKSDSYRRASPGQQAAMRESLQEAAISSRAGGHIQSRRLPRRNVAGASEDAARNLWLYNDSQANYRAKLEWRPQIEDALASVQQTVQDARYDPRIGAEDKLRQSEIANEVFKRARAQDPNQYTGKFTEWARRLATWSYIDRMGRASHLILHQTHLPMITAPDMAGRHGPLHTYTTMLRTWKQAVGAYKAGASDVRYSALDKLHAGTDYLQFFKKTFSKYEDSAGINKMLDTLADIGLIHPEAGIEVAKYQPSRQLGGVVGHLDSFMQRFDTLFRHATNATEAINRYVGAVTAYRLEYAKQMQSGKDAASAHDIATEYARKTIANTQGFYSATNAAPIFKNKFLRPFLQFKQFPQMIYHLLIHNAVKTFQGESTQERVQAAASLLGVLATHTMMTGLLGGLPLESAKIAGLITKGLGVTQDDWSDVERAAYAKAVDMMGPEAADYVMNGVARHLFGVDVHHRLGLNSFFTFGLPDQLTKEKVSTFLFDQALGAPEGLAEDTFKGLNKMMNGDIVGGAAQAFPAQMLRDVMTAWSGGTAHYQYSPAETVGRVLGFTPAGQAEQGERVSNMIQERGEYTNERNALIKEWVHGSDKSGAWAKIQRFNAQYPGSASITMSQLNSARQRNTSATSHGSNYMGLSFNKSDAWIAAQDQRLYGN